MEPSAYSLLPPLVAIGLAIWWRNVLPALFIGVWVGTTILEGGRPDLGLLRILDTLLFEQLAGIDRQALAALSPEQFSEMKYSDIVDPGRLVIVFFTLFLGAMIGVMTASGGSQAVVDRLAKKIHNRRQGQTLTWMAGLVIFFDDYANALLVGSTMRPVTDRLKISREKLAFLIDSTAAPVAGLSAISTWAGFEIERIVAGFAIVGQKVDGWQMFFETLPYRFYPIAMLMFVLMIARTGKDFGSMQRAETDAVNANEETQIEELTDSEKSGRTSLMRDALIPLVVLLASVAIGMSMDLESSTLVLLISSFLASVAAVLSTLFNRTFALNQAMEAWVEGAKSMFPAVVILTMAWMIGGVCDENHLNTGEYLKQTVGTSLTPEWMPSIAFLVAAGVSFSTGSSFATMGLLVVPFTGLSWNILASELHVTTDPIMLATIGSVLAGAIFGDHCSPISDTTVLSSAAADCDHLRHVETQLPYALTVGVTSLLLGCVPIGFGLNVWICILLQLVALFAILKYWGHPPGAIQKQFIPNRTPAPVVAMEPTD